MSLPLSSDDFEQVDKIDADEEPTVTLRGLATAALLKKDNYMNEQDQKTPIPTIYINGKETQNANIQDLNKEKVNIRIDMNTSPLSTDDRIKLGSRITALFDLDTEGSLILKRATTLSNLGVATISHQFARDLEVDKDSVAIILQPFIDIFKNIIGVYAGFPDITNLIKVVMSALEMQLSQKTEQKDSINMKDIKLTIENNERVMYCAFKLDGLNFESKTTRMVVYRADKITYLISSCLIVAEIRRSVLLNLDAFKLIIQAFEIVEDPRKSQQEKLLHCANVQQAIDVVLADASAQ